MPSFIRPFIWPLTFLALAAVLYQARIQHEMVDFEVYRTAAHRALNAESLYRPTDGHYQFKYLPAFALAISPFAMFDREAAKVMWFALSAGLLYWRLYECPVGAGCLGSGRHARVPRQTR